MSSSTVLDLNAAPTGVFTTLNLGDYQLTYAYGDKQSVVHVGGQSVLEDSNQHNLYGAGATLSRTDGGAFTLNSVEIGGGPVYGNFRIVVGGSTYFAVPSNLTIEQPAGTTDVHSVFLSIVDPTAGLKVADLDVTAQTPEPSSLALLGTGILGAAGAVRRRLLA